MKSIFSLNSVQAAVFTVLTVSSLAGFAQTAQTAAAPANQTTTTTAVTNLANWGATFYAEANTAFVPEDSLANSNASAVSYFGVSYKLNPYTKVMARQYFATNRERQLDSVSKELTGMQTKTEAADPTLMINHKSDGVLGSNKISSTLWYYVPTSAKSIEARSNGVVRFDSELVWTLTPKVDVSYAISPRQTLFPENTSVLDDKGKSKAVNTSTRLIQAANLYYNFSDSLVGNATLGLDQSARTLDLTVDKEAAFSELGLSYTVGYFSINPFIAETVPLKKSGVGQVARYFRDDQMSYNLAASLSF